MPVTVGPTTQVYEYQEVGSNVDIVTAGTVGANPHVVLSTTPGTNDNQLPRGEFVSWIVGAGFKVTAELLDYDLPALAEEVATTGTDVILIDRGAGPRKITISNLLPATDLASAPTATTVAITNTRGADATIVAANATNAGAMLPAHVNQLDGTTTGWVGTTYLAAGSVTLAKLAADALTNLGNTPAPTVVTITSSTGASTAVPAADASNAGMMLPAQVNQLDGTTTGWVGTTYLAAGSVTLAKLAADAFTLGPQTNDGTLGAIPTIDWSASRHHKAVLGANVTTLTFIPPAAPDMVYWLIAQDITGGRTVNWANVPLATGGLTPVINTAANAATFIRLYFDGTNYVLPAAWTAHNAY